MKKRCEWVNLSEPVYVDYHDREWGVPVHNDRVLFEMVVLEGFQAGLNWQMILKKRENFRKAFARFNPEQVARFDEERVRLLLQNSGIIRNKMKINAAIQNAKAFLTVQREFGSFDAYLWKFVNGLPIQNKWTHLKEIPVRSPESDAMSQDLKKRGFSFVGSTICYALMQSVGMVNDHLTYCFRWRELQAPNSRI